MHQIIMMFRQSPNYPASIADKTYFFEAICTTKNWENEIKSQGTKDFIEDIISIWEFISSVLLSEYTIPVLFILIVLGLFRIGAMVSSIKSILIRMK